MGDTYPFGKIYDGSARPMAYGQVTITTETINPTTQHAWERPILASGLICPLDSTSGRASAPEPASGFRVANTKRVPRKFKDVSLRNTGRTDMDKGHLIALELGGPDVRQNICPQFSQFQRNGSWRQMETEAFDLAVAFEQEDNLLHMEVAIAYSNAQTFSRGLVPMKFRVTLTHGTEVVKQWKLMNYQDKTDFKMSERKLAMIDPMSEGEEEESYMEWPAPSLGPGYSGLEVARGLTRRNSFSLDDSDDLQRLMELSDSSYSDNSSADDDSDSGSEAMSLG